MKEIQKMQENARKCRMSITPKGTWRAARAALLFSLGEEQTFSECALFPYENGEAAQGTPASEPRGDCEGPESGEER